MTWTIYLENAIIEVLNGFESHFGFSKSNRIYVLQKRTWKKLDTPKKASVLSQRQRNNPNLVRVFSCVSNSCGSKPARGDRLSKIRGHIHMAETGGSADQRTALHKFEAPSMTADLLVGRKPAENGWVKETQNFLCMETLVYIYGLAAMKTPEKHQTCLQHYETLVRLVRPPRDSGFRVQKLLVPFASKDTELTGEKIWNKAQGIKREIKGELYAGIWNRLCPGNNLPSGRTAKDMFALWWQCHYSIHAKKMKMCDVQMSCTPEKAPVDWAGPPYSLVFEAVGLPAKHHPEPQWWTYNERALFDVSDGVAELTRMESKQASREKQRSDKQQQNGFVSLERASKAAEVTADMTRAKAEATYATSQLHTARMAAWKEKMAALEQARRVCMEDAKLAAELNDPDFNPRELQIAALRLGRELRALSSNPPSATQDETPQPPLAFASPPASSHCHSHSPRSTTTNSTTTTAHAHSHTPCTTTPLRRGTPDPDDEDPDNENPDEEDPDDTPLSPPADLTADQTAVRTARTLFEMSPGTNRKTPPKSPSSHSPSHSPSKSPSHRPSPRRSARNTPAKSTSPQAADTSTRKLARANSHSEGGVIAAIAAGDMHLDKRARREGSYREMSKNK